MAFPVEEGLKPENLTNEKRRDWVFMAFPVEEGLKQKNPEQGEQRQKSFYGLSSRRRIETKIRRRAAA